MNASDSGKIFLKHFPELRKDEFWAVKNISFELKRGECLGLIGHNGAGKSTLLKMLYGLVKPDHGRITMKGRIGALIELNAGFNPILTGRENVYVYGSILGFNKKEIDQKYDAIVEFAELDDFMEMPFRSYSSGMKVRLGFAVAAQMEPDVLIIDEVLAVGDVGFRAKCINVIGELSKHSAVIFVSHQMPQIARMCSDICIMLKGKAVYTGSNVPKGIDQYYSVFNSKPGIVTGSGRASIESFSLESNRKSDIEEIHFMDELIVNLVISVDPEVLSPIINISFLNQELQIIAQCNSAYQNVDVNNSGKPSQVRIQIPAVNLNPGIYALSAFITNEQQSEILIQHYAIKQLKVKGNFVGLAPVQVKALWSFD